MESLPTKSLLGREKNFFPRKDQWISSNNSDDDDKDNYEKTGGKTGERNSGCSGVGDHGHDGDVHLAGH